MVFFLVPETKGLWLENMDNLFSDPEHWWQVAAYARSSRGGVMMELNVAKRVDHDDKSASHIERV